MIVEILPGDVLIVRAFDRTSGLEEVEYTVRVQGDGTMVVADLDRRPLKVAPEFEGEHTYYTVSA